MIFIFKGFLGNIFPFSQQIPKFSALHAEIKGQSTKTSPNFFKFFKDSYDFFPHEFRPKKVMRVCSSPGKFFPPLSFRGPPQDNIPSLVGNIFIIIILHRSLDFWEKYVCMQPQND